MKLQPLYDLQQEINRLFIAGSKFSKGDVRLQKHIPVLNKLGERAPVFKKLASDIEELLQTDAQQSAEKLTAIATLLYSVLYTQGETVEPDLEEKAQLPNIDIKNINTEYSYLQLKPVIEALTISKSGRLEILKDALERNIFNDSRTYQYLDIALGDKYSELADFTEQKIIPQVGISIVPFLLQNFNYEDKTENIRRLRLLHRFKAPQLPSMSEKILSESLPGLQAEVINILSEDAKNEELIIKLADDKNKIVREAAYKALVKLNSRASLEKLKNVYLANKNKTNLPGIVTALATSKLPFFFQEVFDQVAKSFQEFIALDKTTDDKILTGKLETFSDVLGILKNKENNQTLDFLHLILQSKPYNELLAAKKNLLSNIAYSITNTIAAILNSLNKAQAIAFYEQTIHEADSYWKLPLWHNYLGKAVEAGYSDAQLFDTFSEAFKKNRINVTNLYHAYLTGKEEYDEEKEEKEKSNDRKIDSRWLDLLYNLFTEKLKWSYEYDHAILLINQLEPKDSKKFNKLLVDLSGKVQPSDLHNILQLIMEREIPDRFELIYATLSKFPKNTYYYTISQIIYSGYWNQFPKTYSAKFRELAIKNKMEFYNTIADKIENIQ